MQIPYKSTYMVYALSPSIVTYTAYYYYYYYYSTQPKLKLINDACTCTKSNITTMVEQVYTLEWKKGF